MKRVVVARFLEQGDHCTVVDVRSPAEYLKGHIPGAVNLPIFNDLERARVGTIYKQQSKDLAIAAGLEIVGPKMNEMASAAKKVAKDGKLAVYCWRGGMRSEKMAWLFELVGLETIVLEGGYKSFRKYLHDYIDKVEDLVVLQGPTGSGKTNILLALRKLGEQVIDLEGLAHHKGSVFGSLGEKSQPTTQQFQNMILDELRNLDLRKRIWIESESLTIGRVYLPEVLWDKMNKARVIAIQVPREQRVKNIIRQYGDFEAELLIAKIEQLEQNLGSNNVKIISEMVGEGRLHEAVDLLLVYYDKGYSHSAHKYKTRVPFKIVLDQPEDEGNAKLLVKALAIKEHESV